MNSDQLKEKSENFQGKIWNEISVKNIRLNLNKEKNYG